MSAQRSIQGILPHMGEIAIPAVRRSRIDEWRGRSEADRRADAISFAEAWIDRGEDGVREHPWWDVLSNLSVARFAINEEE